MTAKENALLFTDLIKSVVKKEQQIKGQFLGEGEFIISNNNKKTSSHVLIQSYIGLLHSVICN